MMPARLAPLRRLPLMLDSDHQRTAWSTCLACALRIFSTRLYQQLREDWHMNWDRLKKRLMGVALVLVLLLGVGGIFDSTAQARARARGGYDRRDDERKGYRDGLDRGEEDARDRRRFGSNN